MCDGAPACAGRGAILGAVAKRTGMKLLSFDRKLGVRVAELPDLAAAALRLMQPLGDLAHGSWVKHGGGAGPGR